MKRRPGASLREAAARTPGQAWRSRDDVIAAVQAVAAEPLPELRVPSGDPLDARRPLRRAYAKHPVIAAAHEWAVAEHSRDGTFAVSNAITYVTVQAIRRQAAVPATDPAPF